MPHIPPSHWTRSNICLFTVKQGIVGIFSQVKCLWSCPDMFILLYVANYYNTHQLFNRGRCSTSNTALWEISTRFKKNDLVGTEVEKEILAENINDCNIVPGFQAAFYRHWHQNWRSRLKHISVSQLWYIPSSHIWWCHQYFSIYFLIRNLNLFAEL